MKTFTVTPQNIRAVMGEINKALFKNHSSGHYVVRSNKYTRKNGKRPAIFLQKNAVSYPQVLAEFSLCNFILCDINFAGEDEPEFLCSVCEGDRVMIDQAKIHIISTGGNLRGDKKWRDCFSLIPAIKNEMVAEIDEALVFSEML